jgi:hypothetical protein
MSEVAASTTAILVSSSKVHDGLTVVAEVPTGEVISSSAKALALRLLSLAWFFRFCFETSLASKVRLTSAILMKSALDKDSWKY